VVVIQRLEPIKCRVEQHMMRSLKNLSGLEAGLGSTFGIGCSVL
jgi:hypothetical protein